MTNRDRSTPAARTSWHGPALGIVGAAALAGILAGCGEDPPPPAPPQTRVQEAPPAPPPPAVTPVATLMANLSIDERIIFEEEQAPPTDAQRIAILEFFDAFARGDVTALGTRMVMNDRQELDMLAKEPIWASTISAIERIEVQAGRSPHGDDCVLALFDVDGVYQPQLWYYKVEEGEEARFESAPTPPFIMDKLYGTDWIARWHELIEEEAALANQLDVEIEVAQVGLEEESDGSASTSSGRPTVRPGGMPTGRRPTPPARKPPGAR